MKFDYNVYFISKKNNHASLNLKKNNCTLKVKEKNIYSLKKMKINIWT